MLYTDAPQRIERTGGRMAQDTIYLIRGRH